VGGSGQNSGELVEGQPMYFAKGIEFLKKNSPSIAWRKVFAGKKGGTFILGSETAPQKTVEPSEGTNKPASGAKRPPSERAAYQKGARQWGAPKRRRLLTWNPLKDLCGGPEPEDAEKRGDSLHNLHPKPPKSRGRKRKPSSATRGEKSSSVRER